MATSAPRGHDQCAWGQGPAALVTPKLLSSGGITDGRTWTHDGVSDGCSTASRPRPDDGRRSFIRGRPKRPFRRFSPYVCLPRLNSSRPTQRSMPSSSPRTGMTGSNSIPAGACGSWASLSIASVPTTSTTISGTPPSIRKSEQAAAIPPWRINLNSGILNPELLSPELGPKVATLWGKCRLQDRMHAVIAHEHHESLGLSHPETVAQAPDAPLPISEGARRILRAIREREQGRERGL